MPTISQAASPISSMQRMRARLNRLVRSILGKVKVPNPSPEGLVRGSGELTLGKVATISNGDEDEESPLASISLHPNGSTPHDDSETSLPSQVARSPYGVPRNLQPAPVRPPNSASIPQTSREFDVSAPSLGHEALPSLPQGHVSGPDSPSGSSAPLAEYEYFQLDRERRRSNLLDLERERMRIRLLELESERTRINLVKLERERTRINLLDQRMVGVRYSMRSNDQAAFAPPETSDQLQSLDLVWSDYQACGANAHLGHYPTNLNHRSRSEPWTTGFRSGLGSVA